MSNTGLGPMQKALVDAGIVENPKPKRKRQQKSIKCRRCGEPMIKVDNTNTMACSNEKCSNFYIFTNNK